jgi:outer membrane protein OmpA-like peptidoglycan-associated protein
MSPIKQKFPSWLIAGFIISLTAGCATPDRIVLLPNADGSPSAVVLKTAAGEHVIDKPYEAVSVGKQGDVKEVKETAESVRSRFGSALEAQPKRPVSFIVYFVSGSDSITAESKSVVDKLKEELKTRTAPEIRVTGHTDRVGKVEDNDALSLQRAQVMVKVLLAAGISANSIEAAGRGEREPLVQTADEVEESRNRRVVINVR